MKVLFIGQANNLEPWFGDVLTAVGEAHQVVLWQPGAPGPSLDNVEVVIEQGGGVVGRETIAAAAAAGVRLWQVLGTGLDHVDVQYILDRGLPLANTPGPFSSVALAEHALFFMLYFAKNFPASQLGMRSGIFYRPMNDELEGATLGLIGLGASARELSRRAAAFGMRLIGLDIQAPPADVLSTLGIAYLGGPEGLADLLGQSDYASIHVPLTRRTRHMVDARALAHMRPHGVLINVARGGIVDQDALVQALRSGLLRGAGLDVFATEPLDLQSPLFDLDNVVLTPHVAGVTTGTSRRRAEAVAENVRRTAARLPPLYAVTGAD
jgi:phosphoglycerate dehydrogenase-like enzyme